MVETVKNRQSEITHTGVSGNRKEPLGVLTYKVNKRGREIMHDARDVIKLVEGLEWEMLLTGDRYLLRKTGRNGKVHIIPLDENNIVLSIFDKYNTITTDPWDDDEYYEIVVELTQGVAKLVRKELEDYTELYKYVRWLKRWLTAYSAGGHWYKSKYKKIHEELWLNIQRKLIEISKRDEIRDIDKEFLDCLYTGKVYRVHCRNYTNRLKGIVTPCEYYQSWSRDEEGIISLGKIGSNILLEGDVVDDDWVIDVNKIIDFIEKNLLPRENFPKRYVNEQEVVIPNWHTIINKMYAVEISNDSIVRNIEIPKDKWFKKCKEEIKMKKQLEIAKEKGYLVTNNSKKVTEYRNEFYRYCKENNKPFIVITNKNKYCYVEVDTITLDEEYINNSEHCINYVNELRELVNEAITKGHLNTKKFRSIGGGFTHFTVLKEQGEHYVQRILEII